MRVINARNVNDAWEKARGIIMEEGVKSKSRNGPVLVHPDVVATVYTNPHERVLFDPVRDANPFFHLMEALWMLSGSDRATELDQFVRDFSSRYSEPDGRMHGAYGHRWRVNFGFDQLAKIVNALRSNPDDRRVVLQMWDPFADWQDKKDIPCNTQAYFRIVDHCLDMTVCCRSNDIVWGCYGANAVHFAFLQEYLAARIGVAIGKYTQISNNWHAYYSSFAPLMLDYDRIKAPTSELCPYSREVSALSCYPLVSNPDSFDEDLKWFMGMPDRDTPAYDNTFFKIVARPMYIISQSRDKDEIRNMLHLMPYYNDWKFAAINWLKRRHRLDHP